MSKYESVIIINPNVDEEGIKSLIQKFTDLINSDGKVEKADEIGKRRLAYEINKYKSGYYYLYEISSNDDKAEKEFNRLANLSEDIIRHMIIKL